MNDQRHQQRRTAPRTILVVEDDPSDFRQLKEAFAEADSDAKLDSVADTDAAIEFLRRLQAIEPSLVPDLVLVDLQVSGRSGLEVVEAIRSDPALTALPVVVLAGPGGGERARQCYEARANACLTKPTDFDELVSLVETFEGFWFGMVTQPPLKRSIAATPP